MTALLTLVLLFVPVGFGFVLGQQWGCNCDDE